MTGAPAKQGKISVQIQFEEIWQTPILYLLSWGTVQGWKQFIN